MAAKLLNSKQVAELLGVKPNTLEGWRVKGCGPRFKKICRLVKYSEDDVAEYLDAATRSSTAEVA